MKNSDQPRLQPDQRQEQRITSHAPLIFTIFSSRFQREYGSMTFNHSKGGMCIETTEPFKPGSVLYIRLGDITADHIYHVNRKFLRHAPTVGEVKWCREHRDKFGNYYRIGVKYL